MFYKIKIRVSNSFDPDQDLHIVGPDWSKLFAKIISKRQKLPLAGKELMISFAIEATSFLSKEYIEDFTRVLMFIEFMQQL